MEELFRIWDERYRETYGPLPARVRELLERFLRCGDLHFGFDYAYRNLGPLGGTNFLSFTVGW